MNEVDEAAISTCNSISQLINLSLKKDEIVRTVLDSIEPVKDLLTNIFRRLELHDRNFLMYPSASEEEMIEMWSVLKSVDPSLEYSNVYRQASLKKLVQLDTFLQHSCQSRHYSFSIKKCGITDCTICKPVRMPLDIFNNIHHLPDPVPSEDGHYTPFSEVYESSTTEQHRRSMQVKRGKQKTLPFSASIQHVKNVSIIIQCEECQKWRLLDCKRKLTTSERCELLHTLDNVTYTCGAQLEDLVDHGSDKQF